MNFFLSSSGTWLLFWPCGWSLCLAAPAGQMPSLHLLATFSIGAMVMRGAGCTINDMWDRKIDNLVQRTRDRPLASGQVDTFCIHEIFYECMDLIIILLKLPIKLEILANFDMILGAITDPRQTNARHDKL